MEKRGKWQKETKETPVEFKKVSSYTQRFFTFCGSILGVNYTCVWRRGSTL
jgi:hypothetical protein